MKCQRCGLCCHSMVVIIRDDDKMRVKPGDVLCPHISFNGAKASCAVHNEPWYRRSPCFIYGNAKIDPDFAHTIGRPCRMGSWVQEKGGLFKFKGPLEQAKMEDLELVDVPEDPAMVGSMMDDVT